MNIFNYILITFFDLKNIISNLYKNLLPIFHFYFYLLQDFQSLTPNIICRITETVIGGGAVVFILPKNIKNLKSLYTYPMDIHSKFTNHCHSDVHYRFNERLVRLCMYA